MPRPNVAKSINRFLDKPVEPDIIRLYTSAQAIVDRGEYYSHHFDRQLSEIDRAFLEQRLAQYVFTLSEPLGWLETKEGAGKLSFRVHEAEDVHQLAVFRRALEKIRSLEVLPTEDILYAEFSRGALAKDIETRRERVRRAGELLQSELRHPTARDRMTVTGLHIVTKDMMHPIKAA